MSTLTTHQGGCHCGAVRFTAQAPAVLEVLECNCSICRMTGFLHLIVPATRFAITQGKEVLTEYRFNTGTARHFFCKTCGIKPFYVPRSNPDGWDINARCLDAVTITAMNISLFDDTQRESATAAIAHLSQQ
jgi:hypothetical protein